MSTSKARDAAPHFFLSRAMSWHLMYHLASRLTFFTTLSLWAEPLSSSIQAILKCYQCSSHNKHHSYLKNVWGLKDVRWLPQSLATTHSYITSYLSMASKRKLGAMAEVVEEPVDPADELMFLCLGGGNEVGRSCHIIQYKGKTIMVRLPVLSCSTLLLLY